MIQKSQRVLNHSVSLFCKMEVPNALLWIGRRVEGLHVGMGSKLMVKDDHGNYDYAAIIKICRDALKLIQEIRGK